MIKVIYKSFSRQSFSSDQIHSIFGEKIRFRNVSLFRFFLEIAKIMLLIAANRNVRPKLFVIIIILENEFVSLLC